MWRFKPFMPKEQALLEGRSISVGNLKIHVHNVIAEGGFSSVYLARDITNASTQYALKHMICNDVESLNVAMKEIQVMKSLRGHSNVVTLYADAIMDMGRTKEAILVMDLCEKSLVNVLESRGSGYFEEKQVLTIFRDVCNAVFAMHCQSPPIAHRDLKAENLLLGADGLWKLCDFGSTSTNHKRFEKPEEMGIEEDNIRKYTTPAYRAPEMWDLFLRELINEKVDIWALGCLLYRICYFKSAFDGDSKLQVLNGNYRIPELPKYSPSITDLIRDMLQASPADRPDITQVWFRVNELLPVELQKSLPEQPPGLQKSASEMTEGIPKPTSNSPQMPRRNPPPPPSSRESRRNSSPLPSRSGGGGTQMGAFWSTQHANTLASEDNKSAPKFDKEPHPEKISTTSKDKNAHNRPVPKNGPSNDFEIKFFQEESEKVKSENTTTLKNESFNAFVADFDTSKLNPGISSKGKEQEIEVEKLKNQLKQVNFEKTEITSKFEKLSAICRSQRQEIQELKQALASRSPSPNKDAIKNQVSHAIHSSPTPTKENFDGTFSELSHGSFAKKTPSPDQKQWQAFSEDPKPNPTQSNEKTTKSVRTRNGQPKTPASAEKLNSSKTTWGFETENFTAVSASNPPIPNRPIGEGNVPLRFTEPKSAESKTAAASQPAGWAGF